MVQHIRWKEPEVSSIPANGFHSKVNRTYSVGPGGLQLAGPGGLPLAGPLTHLSINRRSSPDGSAAEAEPGHLSITGHKQIDERTFSTAAAVVADLRYVDDAKKKAIQALQPVTAAGDGPTTAEVAQPYLGHNGNDECALNRDMEPTLLDQDACDAVYGPVASESRGELLQCEGGTVALEDVLRHYWLLSDRDDEPPKRRDSRSSVSDDNTAVDWNSKRSDANGAYRSQPGPADWIARSPEIMLPLDCDDDADSVVTLSTISEEDEDDLSSTSEAYSNSRINEHGENSFGDAPGDVMRDDVDHEATDFFDVDFLSDSDDLESPSDLSAEMEKVIPRSETMSPVTRLPDGVEDDPPLPSSSSMMDSFVRSFSDYVSDIYPFSSAFVSHDSNVHVGEGPSCRAESNPPVTPAPTTESCHEYTVTDTMLHIKLLTALDEKDFSRHKDQATNTVADQNPEFFWSPNDVRSSIASPTSWYTVSDIYNSQSFETASEMAEDDSGEALMRTANAKCTAVARCLTGHLSQPLDLLPTSMVSLNVTAADPFEAIGRAAARAASQATSKAVRDRPKSENDAEVVEIVVTTTCILNSPELADGNSNADDVLVLKNDASVETRSCSVDVATQISIHSNSFDYTDGYTIEGIRGICFQAASAKHFRNAPDLSEAYFAGGTEDDGVVEEWSSAVDEAATQGSYTCAVAIPCSGPDGDVSPQNGEATYLPMATGVVMNSEDFEVTSVAIREPARKIKVTLPEETVRQNDHERRAVPYNILRSTERLEKDNVCSNLQGGGKKTEDNFRNNLKYSGFLDKPSDTRAVIENKNFLQSYYVDQLPKTKNDKELNPVDFKPNNSSQSAETETETCDGIRKGRINNRQSVDKSPLTSESSSVAQQADTAGGKLQSQTEDASKGIAVDDKTVDSKVGTDLHDPETVSGPNVLMRTCHSTSPQRLDFDERNPKRNRNCKVQKSQSLLLETDIDTLEHRRTPVSRKGSRGSATRSCIDLSCSKVSHYKPRGSPFSFARGSDTPIFSKEALAEMLSVSASSAGSFVKKKPNNCASSPQTVAHCLSEPTLQLSPGKESITSGNSTDNRSTGGGHLLEKFPSGTRWRMYRSQETVSAKKQITSPSPNRTDTAKHIERYEQSPALRRRSLHIIETSLQRRASETGTVQRTLSSQTPPSQRPLLNSTVVKRHLSSPASSSFENLVDSLLGITAVMSMGAAVSQTQSSQGVVPSGQIEPLCGGKSPKNLLRALSETSRTSASQSDARKTRFEVGNEARPFDQTAVLQPLELSGSPVHSHSTTVVRKHVHFRKAKHIFRKCHFCIDANESRSGPPTPSKSPSRETARKKTSGKMRH